MPTASARASVRASLSTMTSPSTDPEAAVRRDRRVLRGSVRIPTSKPDTQRALLMGALATGSTAVTRPNVCSESLVLQEACAELGARFVAEPEHDRIVVTGTGGAPLRPSTILRAAGSGFALRHLVAVTSLVEGPCVLTGDQRLAQRPLTPLLDALTELGGKLETADAGLGLPLVNWEHGLTGGTVRVPADETSQFASALLLVAPYASGPVTVEVPAPVVGAPYIRMTVAMMREFGARVRLPYGPGEPPAPGGIGPDADLRRIEVRPGGYRGRDLLVGPDATSLFYFIAAAVVTDADIVVREVPLGRHPFLDDVVTVGRRLGVRIDREGPDIRIVSGPPPAAPLEIDATGIPTLVPALAAVASDLPAGLRVTGARHIRHHKTSRLAVVMDQLARLGRPLAPVLRDGALDGFETLPAGPPAALDVDGHGDHRNVMALHIAGLALPETVTVAGAETLSTSFADFLHCFRGLAAGRRGTDGALVTDAGRP
ncbi:3-phosphoshikimate 1-carboxyvinyltransferase [Actinacidiphila alni]|uniref:3-phosphoshikimate 1-carboxyvinyltransferase n=2 Tax=Actinacidiphila alni TaxID=380248 RepID=A0A1I1XPA5_9ACTN|nr:3-phosphoshikimate 1-carboxyvinyltransferase [Actinacidiphila alni]